MYSARVTDDTGRAGSDGPARHDIATSFKELRDIGRGIHPPDPQRARARGRARVAGRPRARAGGARRRVAKRWPSPSRSLEYYVVAESLADVGKHARPDRNLDVDSDDDELVVEVVDDGVGGADSDRGSGLRGLADRVEALRRTVEGLEPLRRRHQGEGAAPVRVALAEDSVLLRQGLERLLDGRGHRGRRRVRGRPPAGAQPIGPDVDVAIVDIRLPPTHNDKGFRAALESGRAYPSTAVLVFSQYVELGSR